MFVLKKIISALLSPLALSVIILTTAVFLSLINRAQKSRNFLLVVALLTLLLFSLPPMPNSMLAALENQHQPLTQLPHDTNTIVVLGGGVRGKTDAPPNTQLGSASLARLVEGIRLYQALQHHNIRGKLILSGGRVFGSPDTAGTMRNTAVILGVPAEDIIIEAGSKDTYQETQHLKPILKQRPFILVTSASHMPRALALFKAQGMHPIAAPTQYLSRQNLYSISYFFPNAVELIHADVAIHEYLGLLWAKIIGHT